MNTRPSRMLLILLLALSFAFIGGCGKKTVGPYMPKADENKPEATEITTQSQGSISEETLDTGSGQGEYLGGFAVGGDKNSDAYKKKYGRSSTQMQPIYFNFDQSNIRDDQIIRIEQNAQYLKDNPSTNVIIEGNCDAQGTNEYNLALGERRAMNAQRYLIDLGVEDFRIRTISYGEERPLFTGMDEFDYSQNRRDDFVLE